MVLRHWDPFQDIRKRNAGIYRFGNGLPVWQESREWDGPREPFTWAIPVDIVREGDEIVVHASLPGVDPDDIEVSVEDNLLTIKGFTKETREVDGHKKDEYLVKERRTGSFRRTLRLPKTADADQARPHYDNGVLTVSFPRLESKKVKRLKVSTGDGTG